MKHHIIIYYFDWRLYVAPYFTILHANQRLACVCLYVCIFHHILPYYMQTNAIHYTTPHHTVHV